MSDAPERLGRYAYSELNVRYAEPPAYISGATEYVRADLHDALTEERDRLALANAELLAGLEMISSGSWPGIADKALSGEWKFIFSDAQKIASALLTKHKATSTERESE